VPKSQGIRRTNTEDKKEKRKKENGKQEARRGEKKKRERAPGVGKEKTALSIPEKRQYRRKREEKMPKNGFFRKKKTQILFPLGGGEKNEKMRLKI